MIELGAQEIRMTPDTESEKFSRTDKRILGMEYKDCKELFPWWGNIEFRRIQ